MNNGVGAVPQQYVWTFAERENFKRIDMLRQLFKGNHSAYFILPGGGEEPYEYITINWLGDVVSETWKRFLFRKEPRVFTKDDSVNTFINSLGLLTTCLSAELHKSFAGRAILKCYYSQLSKRPCFKLWGSVVGEYTTIEYLNGDMSMPIAVTFWYTRHIGSGVTESRLMGTDSSNDINPLVLTATNACIIAERHDLVFTVDENDDYTITGTKVTNKAYGFNGGYPVDSEVPWNEIWKDELIKPKQNFSTPLTRLPFVVVHNFDRNGDGDGDTDYTPSLISLQKNINKLVAVRQLIIDMSERPLMKIPETWLTTDSEGKQTLDWDKVRMRTSIEGEPTGEELQITQWTGNLENSDKQWKFYREELYSLTGISPIMTGASDAEGRSGLARRLTMVSSEAEITARRHQWSKGYKDIVSLALEMQNVYGRTNYDITIPVEIQWASALPMESAELTATVIQEYGSGLRSVESSVRNLPLNEDMSEEMVLKEIEYAVEFVAKQIKLQMDQKNQMLSDNNKTNITGKSENV